MFAQIFMGLPVANGFKQDIIPHTFRMVTFLGCNIIFLIKYSQILPNFIAKLHHLQDKYPCYLRLLFFLRSTCIAIEMF